jgi:aminopeptidase 2
LFSVIKELQSRFEHFMKTGDDSHIPADLQRVIFSTVLSTLLKSCMWSLIKLGVQVVCHGGQAEYDAIVGIYNKPSTPTARVAAMCVFLYLCLG